MICFLNEVYKRLRLNESLSKLFLVDWTGILYKIKNLVSWSIRFWKLIFYCSIRLYWLSILWILFEEIFKIIDQIEKKVKKKLFYSECKFAALNMLSPQHGRVIFWVWLTLEFVHLSDIIFKLLYHERYIRLRLRWQSCLVLHCLRLEVKDDYIFIHSVPSIRISFLP